MLPDDDPDFRDGVGTDAPRAVVRLPPVPEGEVTVVVFLVVVLFPVVVDMVKVFSVPRIPFPAVFISDGVVAPSADCVFLLVSFPLPVVLFSITAVVDTGLEMEILIGIFEDCPAACSGFGSVVVLVLMVSVLSKRSSVVLEVLVLSLSVVTLNTVSLS